MFADISLLIQVKDTAQVKQKRMRCKISSWGECVMKLQNSKNPNSPYFGKKSNFDFFPKLLCFSENNWSKNST
jgi:hypothetical protein